MGFDYQDAASRGRRSRSLPAEASNRIGPHLKVTHYKVTHYRLSTTIPWYSLKVNYFGIFALVRSNRPRPILPD